jgi:hypothetical protein
MMRGRESAPTRDGRENTERELSVCNSREGKNGKAEYFLA